MKCITIVFAFIFVLLLTKMLITIVIIRYIHLRSLSQLHNEAIARISYREEILFLFFGSKNKDRDEVEKFDIRNSNLSILQKLKYFFTKVFSAKPLKSKDEITKEIKDTIKEIKKERKDKLKKRGEKVGLKSISKMKKRCLSLSVHILY